MPVRVSRDSTKVFSVEVVFPDAAGDELHLVVLRAGTLLVIYDCKLVSTQTVYVPAYVGSPENTWV